ncbi:CHAP domain-containing protein [bacterium]|nr:CHAP domain-containing protein [bacterium]
MSIGMMPMGIFTPRCSYFGSGIGNSITPTYNFNLGRNTTAWNFSPRMNWNFLNTYSAPTMSNYLSGSYNRGYNSWFSSYTTPTINNSWLNSKNYNSGNSWYNFNSGFNFNINSTNPFGNSVQLQQFFGIGAPPVLKFNTASFGSITSGTSTSSQQSNNSFVPTSDYAENAARVAEQELAKGVKETSKNDSVDIRRYKNGARNSHQWCAYFTSYCFGAGQNKKPIFGFTGSSQHIRRQAEKAGVFVKKNSGYIPKRGDIAIWTNIGDPNHGHVGVVTQVYADGSFDVIEGNSSNRVKKNHYKSPTSVSKRFAGFCKTSEWAK